jgi:hypothetical protein
MVQDGGSLMIWEGFGALGKTELKFIESSMDALSYKALLIRALLPFELDFIIQTIFFNNTMLLAMRQN